MRSVTIKKKKQTTNTEERQIQLNFARKLPEPLKPYSIP